MNRIANLLLKNADHTLLTRLVGKIFNMIDTPQEYLAYLVRIWKINTGEGNEESWCASITNALTNERRGFASLDELLDYLRTQAYQKYRSNEKKGGKNDLKTHDREK